MRVIRMNECSKYWGTSCGHCAKHIADGRVALVSTYFVQADGLSSTHGMNPAVVRNLATWREFAFAGAPWTPPVETEVKVAFHRDCIERLLGKTPRRTDELVEHEELEDTVP